MFWLCYVLFFGLFYGKYGHDYKLHLLETSFMLPFVMFASYTTIYAVLPYYLRTKNIALTVVVLIVLLFSVTLFERIFIRWLNHLPITSDSMFGVTFLYLFLETNFMVGMAFAIKFCKIWFEHQQEKHDIEKKNLETELKLLKAQLHPHFLFNTMNNLYALSLEESSKTSEGIAKISNLLRSVLYECNEAEVALENEIELIRNYIDLEKMRYCSRLNVTFDVEGEVDGKKIAPMLLFTFIENSFKHGCSNDSENPYIQICINISKEAMNFTVENSKPKEKTALKEKKPGGIGLVNARKRLEIIYPGKHKLECNDRDCSYFVSLTIKS